MGILGGGQLGKMLALAASSWDIQTAILDKEEDTPAAPVCGQFCFGDFRDEETVYQFGRSVDILTIEIEQVNLKALKRLAAEGKKVYPEPHILEKIQDKYIQNQIIRDYGFPKADFAPYENAQDIRDAVSAGKLSLPFVQKSRLFGYDGRGVRVIKKDQDLADLLDVPSVVEKMISIKKEISVMAARNPKGDVVSYDPAEMIFNPRANLVDYLISPADISSDLAAKARELAEKMIQKLGVTGILAVEMFLDQSNNLWINELAPRPHNSGHHTIEGCITSQYEQHLRAIFNLPLGSTRVKMPSLMLNLLGEPGFEGPVRYDGLTECMAIEGVKIHIYGKKTTKPFRKMGHVTILDNSLELAQQKAAFVRGKLKVVT